MSTPTAERIGAARPTRFAGGGRRSAVPTPRQASSAIERAYARRAGRARRLASDHEDGTSGRSRFVVMIMGLLGVGLVATLWLSTTAAADSYRLDEARSATQELSERSEALRSEIAAMESAPALALAAQRMGMVPTSDVARLVLMPDGSVRVVGTPRVALPPPAPTPAAAQPVPSGQRPASGQAGQQATSGQAGQQAAPNQRVRHGGEQAIQGQNPAPVQRTAHGQRAEGAEPSAATAQAPESSTRNTPSVEGGAGG